MQYLTQKGGQYLRLLQLVDQLIVPGIKEARAQAKVLPCDNRQQRCLRQECLGHLDWLHARKWTFFALAALYYPTQKQHRIFKDHPFFQNEEAVRLFEELWIPLVQNSFDLGAKVYMHLCGPRGKDLLHAAKLQPGHAMLPSNNAEKRQLLDTLATLIDSNQHQAFVMPGPAAKPEACAPEASVSAAAESRPATPPTEDAPPASVMLPRKLEFDGTSISLAKLMTVYLDGYNRFPAFIRFYPVPDEYGPLPAHFRPEAEQKPGWGLGRNGWGERSFAAYDVCKQACWLQQQVAIKTKEYGSQKKLKIREGIDLRTAVNKVTSLLQAALDANKKAKQHPWTVCELGVMFRDLLQGKAEIEVTRSINVPAKCRTRAPNELQGWLRIVSSGDVDAIVAALYA